MNTLEWIEMTETEVAIDKATAEHDQAVLDGIDATVQRQRHALRFLYAKAAFIESFIGQHLASVRRERLRACSPDDPAPTRGDD